MDVYKDFVQRLRKKELEDVYLLLAEGAAEKLKKYVLLLKNVEFEEGRRYKYYGEVKRIIASFIVYFTTTIDEVVKLADTYTNVIQKDDLLLLTERTLTIHENKQIEFRSSFLPVKTEQEKHVLEVVESCYNAYSKKLIELRTSIEITKKSEVGDFAKEHFPIAVKKTNEMFDMAHVYLAMVLADCMKPIRLSLVDIRHRLIQNFNKVREKSEEDINSLLHQLYDKNKEYMMITRREANRSGALAEVTRRITDLKTKIENFDIEIPIARLEKEIAFWTRKIEYFNEIFDNLTKLKAEQDRLSLIQSQKSLKCNLIPGCKEKCCPAVSDTLAKRKEDLTQIIINETKALMTFFALRGTDRITYTDKIGVYYLDEFDHKVYIFDYSLDLYHVDCDGEFKHYTDFEHSYDENGRFLDNDDREKVYQCAPCTSRYKLNDAGLLVKVTEDCGHSERDNNDCKMGTSDRSHFAILPDFDAVDIKNTLDTETVRYLWDSFGSVLPVALHDVGRARPKNPIHFLAHKLLRHKYGRTKTQELQKKQEANQYREDIFQKRLEKAVAESKKWKSKQVKPRKPEESDDAETWAIYNAQVAQLMFINSLNTVDD